MKKPGLAALIGLAMMWGTTSAQAQGILFPIGGGGGTGTGPGRPGMFGSSSLFGNPFGPGTVPGGGFRPGIGTTLTGPGLDAGTTPAGPSTAELNQGFVTGHAVGFQTHRGYFLNLNAAAGGPAGAAGPSGGPAQPIAPPNLGIFGSSTNLPGKKPAKAGGK